MTAFDLLASAFDIQALPINTADTDYPPLLLTARRRIEPECLGPDAVEALLEVVRPHAALLLRGLKVTSPGAVAVLGDQLLGRLPVFTTGEHPLAEGSDTVYRPVRYAPDEKLLWHQENTFNNTWPRLIMFASVVPAAHGGQTPLVDSRLVYAQVPAQLRDAFATHGICYQRMSDGVSGRNWRQIYRTDDPDTAQARARDNGERLELTSHGAIIGALRPAFLPVRSGTSWFNQLLHWHPDALPGALRQMISDGLLAPPRTCTLGNGEPIEASTVETLIEVHRDLEYPVAWQPGDVLLFDNEVMAHARNPYRGRREHYVRMAGLGAHAR